MDFQLTYAELCQALDDLTPEEIEAELEPVKVQEIYLLARTGQLEGAQERAKDLDLKKYDMRHVF